MKYIYRFDRVGYNAVHRTASEKNKEFSRRYSVVQKTRFRIRKLLRALLAGVIGDRIEKPRIDSCYAPPEELHFLHFMGLSTRWQSNWLTDETSFDDAIHVEEPVIAELAKLTGLLENNDQD